jgi:ribosome biogenesis GTPase / thiamine phosphate phosphatase
MPHDGTHEPAPPSAMPELIDPSLETFGWSAERDVAFEPHAAAGLIAGRIVSSGSITIAVTSTGLTEVILQRRFKRSVTDRTQLPTVGDWLALAPEQTTRPQAALRAVLPRAGTFMRNRLSDGRAQVLAANVDVAFIVSGLDHDLNLRRIERYLVLALDGGVRPIILLNKADVAVDLEAALVAVGAVAADTQVLVSSATTGNGIETIREHIGPGVTACLLGSSGVGKSTITNALLGEQRQAVKALREADSRGRHTTTHRELFLLAGGGMLIDTPGLRTVGILGDAASVDISFVDVEAIARECRFPDCQHQGEPGCAVAAAIEAGSLPPERLHSYRKLEAERHAVELRADARARREAQRDQGRMYRRISKDVGRYKRGEH